MNATELALIAGFAVVLLGLAVFFAWRQFHVLASIRASAGMPADEQRFLRRQVSRRLLCCGLMLLFACFFVGWFFLEGRYRDVLEQTRAREAAGNPLQPTEAEKDFLRFLAAYWGAALLVLLALLCLAAIDAWAIVRFGVGQHRKLTVDHRATLEEQLARHRSQRNGFQ